MSVRRIIILTLFIFTCGSLKAQVFKLKIKLTDSNHVSINNITYKKTYQTKADMLHILNDALQQMYNTAHLAATIDSVKTDTVGSIAFLSPGKQYLWATLAPGNVDEGWISEIGFHENVYDGNPVNYKQVSNLLNKLLRYAEDHGYPFARIHLENFHEDSSYLSAEIHLQLNDLILWDTVEVIGDSSISPRFLANYLGIKKGAFYSETVARNISNRLKELLYIRLTSPPRVIFKAGSGKAVVKLSLEEQKSSRFDLIAGAAPNTTGPGIELTGEFSLETLDLLGRGITLDISAKKLVQSTEQLDIAANYPYITLPIIGSTNFGIGGTFDLLRYDTLYTTVNAQINLSYYLSGKNYLKILYGIDQSQTINNVNVVPNSLSAPANIDYTTYWYGLGLNLQKLDNALNPRSGYTLFFEGKAGIKYIKENPEVVPEFYDSIQLKRVVYKIAINGNYFFPIGRRSTIITGFKCGIMVDNQAFQNQVYRVGGLNTLLGFDDGSIYANQYYIPSIEYRFLTTGTSFIQAFVNAAYYKDDLPLSNIDVSAYPIGFGLGYGYQTKAGMFLVNFAVGTQNGSPIDFNNAKVHVGYNNNF